MPDSPDISSSSIGLGEVFTRTGMIHCSQTTFSSFKKSPNVFFTCTWTNRVTRGTRAAVAADEVKDESHTGQRRKAGRQSQSEGTIRGARVVSEWNRRSSVCTKPFQLKDTPESRAKTMAPDRGFPASHIDTKPYVRSM